MKTVMTWGTRLEGEFASAEPQWVSANVPAGAMVAIQYYHPKYSPDADRQTTEWGGTNQNSWIKFPINGSDRHPDDAWGGSFLGTSYNSSGNQKKITVPRITNSSGVIDNLDTRVSIVHEVGHASKYFFERASFGSGDHLGMPGLMDPPGSTNKFNSTEEKILKGGKHP